MVNLKTQDKFFLLLGIIGGCVLLFGLTQLPAETYYVVGSVFLLVAALHFKLIYFIALELIFIAGHGAILLQFNKSLQIALPVLMSSQLLFYYLLSGQLTNIFLFIGILGIGLLSIGFAYENQWIFFLGSSSIALYGFYSAYHEKPINLLWAILNTMFALIAIYKLFFS